MVRETPQNTEPFEGPGSSTAGKPDLQRYRSERLPVPKTADPDFLFACAVALDQAPEKEEKPDDKPKEKKKPKDGQTIPLSELLTDYQTPFIDAYDKSKSLKDGDAGKSPTLETVIDRMKACPWYGQLKVKFDSKAKNPDYDPATSTITINPNEPIEKQIELFAHEGYHATNARLYKLYLDKDLPKGGLAKKDYAEIMGDAEVGAFETEIKVHKELGHKGTVSYKYVDKDDKKQEIDLAELYKDKGRAGLKTFILDDARTRMEIGGKEGLYTYRQYYEAAHKSYADNFAANQGAIKGLGEKDPNWSEKTLKEKDY